MIKKIISMSLIISLLFSVSSFKGYALSVEKESQSVPTISFDQLPNNITNVLKESKNSKILLDDDLCTVTSENPDGTKTSCMFGIPVKYKNDNNEIEFIDTSIRETNFLERAISGYDYINGGNEFKIEFSKNPKNGVKISNQDYNLKMSIIDPFSETKSIVIESERNSKTGDFSEMSFVYENAFGVDTAVKYTNTNIGLKEDIILEKNIGINKFDFEIDTSGDVPILSSDNSTIAIADKSDQSIIKYTFGKLCADDSFGNTNNTNDILTSESFGDKELVVDNTNVFPDVQDVDQTSDFNHYTEDIYYELTSLGGTRYKVTIVVSSDYLNSPDVVYPVTIDPSVVLSSVNSIDDTYIIESDSSTTYRYAENRLRIGNYNGIYPGNECHAYINYYSKPALFGCTIVSANLTFSFLNGQTTPQGGVDGKVNRVTTPWTAQNTNAQTQIFFTEAGAATSISHNLSYYSFNVTDIVNAWYNLGAGEYGFRVVYYDQTILDHNALYSSNCGVADYVPKLYITYEISNTYCNEISEGFVWLVQLDSILTPVGFNVSSTCYVKTQYLTNRTTFEISNFAKTYKNPSPEIESPSITIGTTRINNNILDMDNFTNVIVSPDWIWKCSISYQNIVVNANSTFSSIAICMLNNAIYPYRSITNSFDF